MMAGELLLSHSAFFQPRRDATATSRSQAIFLTLGRRPNPLDARTRRRRRSVVGRTRSYRPLSVSQKSDSDGGRVPGEDFVSRVLRENPSQVEPRFLVGDRFVTLREKEKSKEKLDAGLLELVKRFYGKWGNGKGRDEVGVGGRGGKGEEASNPVYLKDLLREFKGELYVPEEVFKAELSEEEEFNRNLEVLPKMGLEDFMKYLRTDKIKLLTSKSIVGASAVLGSRDFIVDLKEIPGDKNLQRTKWTIKLAANQARAISEEYTGPQYEIEKHTTESDNLSHEFIHYSFYLIHLTQF